MEYRGSFFASTPATVRHDKTLPGDAKQLYTEISSLWNAEGYCWATNSYFAEIFGVSERTISRWVAALEKRGYIRTEQAPSGRGSERRIFIGVLFPESEEVDKNVEVDKSGEEEVDKNVYLPKGNILNLNNNKQEIEEKEIKKKKKTAPKELDEETKELLRGYVGDDGELRLKLADMIIARNERGAVNSHRAVKALLNLLDKYSEGNRALKLELLERAIASGWQTVYPLKPWEAAAILSDIETTPAGSGRFQSAQDSGERIIRPEDSPWYRYKKEQENGKV